MKRFYQIASRNTLLVCFCLGFSTLAFGQAEFIIRVNTTLSPGTGATGGSSNTPTPIGQFFLRSGVPTTGVNITIKDITGTTTLHTYPTYLLGF